LDNIHDGDWALYAGVEFGNNDYLIQPDSVAFVASCASGGGAVEVWLDSLDTGTEIVGCNISSTGGWTSFATFTAKVLSPVTGRHDVYLRFSAKTADRLFMLQSFVFVGKSRPATSIEDSRHGHLPNRFELEQNYPNPFNPTTTINYQVAVTSRISLNVFNLLGQNVETLVDDIFRPGNYMVIFNGAGLASSIYFCQMDARNGDGVVLNSSVRKMLLVK
jgi:hypothetical protein